METHEALFAWILERLSAAGLLRGNTVGVDATTLEANAAMRSIEPRDTGESYAAFIQRLAEASGGGDTDASGFGSVRPVSEKQEDVEQGVEIAAGPGRDDREDEGGRTHLAHKAEHGVDMDTRAIVSVTVQDASDGDTATLPETLITAAEQVELVQPAGPGVEELVADKGYHSDETLVALGAVGVRSCYVSEPERGQRGWRDKKTGETPPEKRAAQRASYANRRRVGRRRGRRLQRCRGEVVERTFAHMYECVGCGCAVTRMSASGC